MSGVSKIEIKESIEDLKTLLNQQKTPENFQKIQTLYLLKTQQAANITQAALIVGRHRITVQGWLGRYQQEGMEGLLASKPRRGRKSTIPDWAIALLQEQLVTTSNLTSYKAIQRWLEKQLNTKISYDVVYYLVRDKLKLSLKKTKIGLLQCLPKFYL